jgi:hypothetical protein
VAGGRARSITVRRRFDRAIVRIPRRTHPVRVLEEERRCTSSSMPRWPTSVDATRRDTPAPHRWSSAQRTSGSSVHLDSPLGLSGSVGGTDLLLEVRRRRGRSPASPARPPSWWIPATRPPAPRTHRPAQAGRTCRRSARLLEHERARRAHATPTRRSTWAPRPARRPLGAEVASLDPQQCPARQGQPVHQQRHVGFYNHVPRRSSPGRAGGARRDSACAISASRVAPRHSSPLVPAILTEVLRSCPSRRRRSTVEGGVATPQGRRGIRRFSLLGRPDAVPAGGLHSSESCCDPSSSSSPC